MHSWCSGALSNEADKARAGSKLRALQLTSVLGRHADRVEAPIEPHSSRAWRPPNPGHRPSNSRPKTSAPPYDLVEPSCSELLLIASAS
mgnify:CR=1 FL=1